MNRPCGETVLGCILMALSGAWWMSLLHDLNVVLSTGSLIFGFIIGAHGVWRIVKGRG